MAIPLQYSCLGNSMDRGAWRATVHGIEKESDTTKLPSIAHSKHTGPNITRDPDTHRKQGTNWHPNSMCISFRLRYILNFFN